MINHIELAKECGISFGDGIGDVSIYGNINELAAYTNAIVEQCAKVAEEYDPHYGSEVHIRALKVTI